MLLASARGRMSGGPVGREVVLDAVDPLACRVAGADLAHEGEVVAAASARPQPDPEPVGVPVERAEHVPRAVAAVVDRSLALGPLALSPARTGRRTQADR